MNFYEYSLKFDDSGENGDLGCGQKDSVSCFSVDEWLSLLGHELRTPLAGTLGMLELVLTGELAAEQRNALELANASARTMLRLVEDLHDLARLETGRAQLQQDPFEVRSWVQNLTAELNVTEGVRVLFMVDARVPELLVGDSGRMSHVLLNLIEIYLKRGGVACLKVGLAMDTLDGAHFLRIDVGDVCGEEMRVALLWACGNLSRVPLAALRQVGVKQAVVRNLTAFLGGALWPAGQQADAEIRSLVLPVALPTEYAVTSIEPQVAEKIPKMEGGRSAVSILLVEDDDAIRKLVELLLQQRSWQVTAVADGVQALESLQSRQFDLALMDIRMPRLDGLETTRRIRRRERILVLPPLPIVGMTAHAAQQDRAMCLEAGMNDHVSKPIASAHLYAIIEKCLAC